MYPKLVSYDIVNELFNALETEGFPMGIDHVLSIQRILQNLPLEVSSKELKFAISPVLARTPEEQAFVYHVFDECEKRVLDKNSFQQSDDNSLAFDEVVSKTRKLGWVIILSSLLLIIGSGIGVYYFSPNPTNRIYVSDIEHESPIKEHSNNSIVPLFDYQKLPFNHNISEYVIKDSTPFQQLIFHNIGWIRLFFIGLLIFIAIAFWYYLQLKHQKLIVERSKRNNPPFHWNIKIPGVANFIANNTLAYVSQIMKRRGKSDVFSLDLNSTIAATLREGGMPIFRYKELTQPVEYIVLIERRNINDHRAKFFSTIVDAFQAEEVDVVKFFFDSDIRVCTNESNPVGISLVEMQHRYPQAHLLIISSGTQFISPISGKLAPWTEIFLRWKNRVLFTPKAMNDWGRAEKVLNQAFPLLQATLQSLRFWVEEQEKDQQGRIDDWKSHVKDLVNYPIILVDEESVPTLELVLPKPIFMWIAACSIYPKLHWELTLWLGTQIPVNGDPLVSLENLATICTVPWFVEGEIPEFSRDALLKWFESEDPTLLSQIRLGLVELLKHNPPPQNSAAYDSFQMTVSLNEWSAKSSLNNELKNKKKIIDLLKAGVEPDPVVIKRLGKPANRIDFLVPDSWKKIIYSHGLPALGWRKSLLLLLPALFILFVYISSFYYQLPAPCTGESATIKYKNDDINICLSQPKAKLIFQEHLIREEIKNATPANISLVSGLALLRKMINTYRNDVDSTLIIECRKNLAIALYNRGVDFYFDNNYDFSCWFFKEARGIFPIDKLFSTAADWCESAPSVDTLLLDSMKDNLTGETEFVGCIIDNVTGDFLEGVQVSTAEFSTYSNKDGRYKVIIPDTSIHEVSLSFNKNGYEALEKLFILKGNKFLPSIILNSADGKTQQNDEGKYYSKYESYAQLDARIKNGKDTTFVIYFWATWCMPCVQDIPYYESLHEKYKTQKVKVLMVSLDFKDQAGKKLDDFIKRKNITSEVILLSTENMNEWIKRVSATWDGAIPAMIIRKSGLKPFFKVSSLKYPELEELLVNYIKNTLPSTEAPVNIEKKSDIPAPSIESPSPNTQPIKNTENKVSVAPSPRNNSSYTVGDKAGNFTLKNFNGVNVSLSDYKSGKGVIVVFQCNHCPYSQLYEQRIIDLHKKFSPLGFPVIAINPSDPNLMPEESLEEIKHRATQKKYSFEYLIDSEFEIAPIFGARRTPHVFVLDNDFIIQYIGAIDDSPETPGHVKNSYVENAVNALLKGELPNPNYTRAVGCTIKTLKRR